MYVHAYLRMRKESNFFDQLIHDSSVMVRCNAAAAAPNDEFLQQLKNDPDIDVRRTANTRAGQLLYLRYIETQAKRTFSDIDGDDIIQKVREMKSNNETFHVGHNLSCLILSLHMHQSP